MRSVSSTVARAAGLTTEALAGAFAYPGLEGLEQAAGTVNCRALGGLICTVSQFAAHGHDLGPCFWHRLLWPRRIWSPNSGFETGDFSGWNTSAIDGGLFVACGNATYPANSGNCDAVFSQPADAISQYIATIPGDTYTFDFWVDGANAVCNDLVAGFGSCGTAILGPTGNGYVHYVLSDCLATSASTGLDFVSGGIGGQFWLLDDVSMTPSPVPEPRTTVALFFGLAVLVLVRLRHGVALKYSPRLAALHSLRPFRASACR